MKTIFAQLAIPLSCSNKDAIAVPSRDIPVKRILMGLAITLGAMLSHDNAIAQPGTVLNYTLRTVMSNAGIDADARGTVNMRLVRNGSGESQRLKILLAKLDPNTTYQWNAFLGADAAPTSVAEFTTDQRGSFVISHS